MSRADPSDARDDDRAARAFLALAWIASVVVLAAWLRRFDVRWPWNDDVTMAPFLDPRSDVDWSSYWLPHNEHRIPLVKLAFVGLVRLTHGFGAIGWVHLALLSVLALALMWALRVRTGVSRAADAWIPLALLSPGNAENLLGTFQLAFLLPVALTGALLVAALLAREPLRPRGIALVWVALLALLLLGSIGFVAAVALAAWPLHAGWCAWRARAVRTDARRAVAVAAGGALFLATVAVLYLVGLPPRSSPPDVARVARVAVEFTTGALGPASALYWPATAWSVCLVVVGAVAVGLRRARDAAGAALLVHALAGVALAVSVGIGRGADGVGAGFVNRYMMPAALAVAAAYAVWRVLGRGALGRLAELVVLTLFVGAWLHGFDYGNQLATGRQIAERRLERALDAGAGVREIARDHWRGFYYGEEAFADLLAMWRRAGFFELVPGERLEPPPPAREILGVEPLRLDGIELAARSLEDGPALVARGRIELELAVPDGAGAVAVSYALESLGRGIACTARVELASSGAEHTPLAEVTRAPSSKEGDEGWRVLRAELPKADARRVVVVFEPSGGASDARDPSWILLRGVSFPTAR